jgi:hypothetical protein
MARWYDPLIVLIIVTVLVFFFAMGYVSLTVVGFLIVLVLIFSVVFYQAKLPKSEPKPAPPPSVEYAAESQSDADIKLVKAYAQLTKISLFHPKLLSKRLTSSFICHIYARLSKEKREELIQTMVNEKDELLKYGLSENIFDTSLFIGQKIKVELSSIDIEFSKLPSYQVLNDSSNVFSFHGKPKDSCQIGNQWCTLTITDDGGNLLQSNNFPVNVIDFAFDHVSRPQLSRVVTAAGYIGSILLFVLTILEKFDTTLGLTSGTTAVIVSTVILGNYHLNYRKLIESYSG